jgi:hypothetical protein
VFCRDRASWRTQLRNTATRPTNTVSEGPSAASDVRKQPPSTDLPAVRDEEAVGSNPATPTVIKIFAAIRPATSMLEISNLIDAALLVEIEADAIVRGRTPDGTRSRKKFPGDRSELGRVHNAARTPRRTGQVHNRVQYLCASRHPVMSMSEFENSCLENAGLSCFPSHDGWPMTAKSLYDRLGSIFLIAEAFSAILNCSWMLSSSMRRWSR